MPYANGEHDQADLAVAKISSMGIQMLCSIRFLLASKLQPASAAFSPNFLAESSPSARE